MKNNEQYLNAADASKLLGIAVQTLANYRHRGIGPKYAVWGKRGIRYPKSDLIKYMESRVVTPHNSGDDGYGDQAAGRGGHEV